jgi:opacity protein-like surface antigen
MGSLKALCIAGVAAASLTTMARAADLPPPPQLEPVAPVTDFSGWYLRADVGVGAATLRKFTPSFAGATPAGFTVDEKHLDDSAFAGVGAGYKFNSWLRFDATGEYRTSQRFQAIEHAGLFYDTYNGSIQSSVFLANGYFDLGTWCGFTPYIGGGAGVAFNRVSSLTDVGAGLGAGGIGWAPDHGVTTFAWAAMAGISYDITPNVKLDIGYRHLDMGKAQSATIACAGGCTPAESHRYDLASNDIRVGLRWMFNVPAPPIYQAPPETPLIRKY